jgi:hypothetical protein
MGELITIKQFLCFRFGACDWTATTAVESGTDFGEDLPDVRQFVDRSCHLAA